LSKGCFFLEGNRLNSEAKTLGDYRLRKRVKGIVRMAKEKVLLKGKEPAPPLGLGCCRLFSFLLILVALS